MAAQKVTEFIEEEQGEEASAVQGFIPKELRQKVLEQFKADRRAGIKVTWSTFIKSACKAYLLERGHKK